MFQHQHHVSASRHTPPELIPVVVPTIDPHNEPMMLCNWLIDCGERIEQGENILEISLPGIVWDVPSPASGRLERIASVVSDTLQPGDVCGWIRPDASQPGENEPSASTDATGSNS